MSQRERGRPPFLAAIVVAALRTLARPVMRPRGGSLLAAIVVAAVRTVRRPVVWFGGGLLLVGLLPLTWLGSGELVNGNDTNYPLRAEHFLAVRQSSWDWTMGTGVSNLAGLSTATWGYLLLALQELTGSAVVAQRILLVLWFTAIPASFALLFRTLSGRWRIAHFVGALAYAFNPYFTHAWSNVLVATIGAAVAAPLLLALALQILPKRSSFSSLALAGWGVATLLLSLVAASPPSLAIVAGVVITGVLSLARPIAWRRAAMLATIGIGANSFWLVPQFLFLFTTEGVASTGSLKALGLADWTKGVSSETSLLNVMRGAGAWDWFADWNGEPYVSYADDYLQNPLLVAVSIAIPLAALSVLVFDGSSAAKFFGVLAVLGLSFSTGAHPPFGVVYVWATENVPLFSGFRSPWYKFGLLTYLGLAGLITIGLSRATDALRERRRHAALNRSKFRTIATALALACTAAMAVVSGGPLVTGEVLLPDRNEPPGFRVTIPGYVEQAGHRIQRYGSGTRVLWLPRRSEIYRWGLATGAGSLLTYVSDASVVSDNQFLPKEADRRMTARLLDSIDRERVTEALRIGRLLGIRLIVARSDVEESFYFASRENPAFLRQVLGASNGVRRVASIGRWTIYELNDSPARVTGTPSGLLVPGPVERLADAATFFGSSDVTLVSTEAAHNAGPSFPALPQVLALSRGEAISLPPLHGPSHALVKIPSGRFRVSLERTGRQAWLTVRRLADQPRFGHAQVIVPAAVIARRRVPPDSRSPIFRFDGRVALGTITRLGPGMHIVEGVSSISPDLVRDGSFERGHWMKAIDAGPPPGLQGRLTSGLQTARRVSDAFEGNTALELVSTGNRAAVYRTLKIAPQRTYQISLSHRHVTGGPGAFAVLSDGRLLVRRSLSRSARWKTYKIDIRIRPSAKTLQLYLYSDSVGERSVNRFDSVRVSQLGVRRHLTLRFEVVPPVSSIPIPAADDGPIALRPYAVSGNLIGDGSFERGHWMDPINAGPPPGSAGGTSPGRQVARQVLGGTDGRNAIELLSTENRAAVFQMFVPYGPGRAFEVTLDHRHVRGGSGSYAIVAGSRTLLARKLSVRSRWTRHKAIVYVPRGASEVSLYLYSDSTGQRSVNLFDRVRVVRLRMPEFLRLDAPSHPAETVRLESTRVSPTRYVVRVRQAPGMFLLTLRENFHEGWTATGRVQIGPHFRSSGYANGWVVRGARRGDVIEIHFRPHDWTLAARLVSIGTGLLLLIAVAALALSAWKRAARDRAAFTSAADTS